MHACMERRTAHTHCRRGTMRPGSEPFNLWAAEAVVLGALWPAVSTVPLTEKLELKFPLNTQLSGRFVSECVQANISNSLHKLLRSSAQWTDKLKHETPSSRRAILGLHTIS